MTTSDAFTPEEWRSVVEVPPTAGMIVVTAARGGMFRETLAMSKAYVEARSMHGQSEFLDQLVAAKPKVDHGKYRSPEELREHGLQHLRDVMTLVESKATPEEADGFRHFVLGVADKVANAHREDGQSVSAAEAEAIAQIATALGAAAS